MFFSANSHFCFSSPSSVSVLSFVYMEGNGKGYNISISPGTIVTGIVLVALSVFLYQIRDILLVVLAAVVLASAIEPFTIFTSRFGIARIISVIATYLLLGIIFFGVVFFFLPPFLEDTASFLRDVPRYLDAVAVPQTISSADFSVEKEAVGVFSDGFDKSRQAVKEGFSGADSVTRFLADIREALGAFSGGFLETVGAIFGGVLGFVLVVVISFYLAAQEDGVAKFLQIITPLRSEKYVINLWRRAQVKIGRWMQGQLLLAVLVGVMVYLGLTIFGIKNALFLAVLAALFEAIPLFGPILSAIPAVAVSYVDGGINLALVVTGIYLIIQQFENHLIYPLVVKKIVGVPPILVVLGLIVGAKLAGFLGIILSVPIATTLVEYLDDVQRDKIARGSV